MRTPPGWLPPADSTKWHNRRSWDGLGYIRVRTLGNPAWTRDVDWLIQVIESHRPSDPGTERDALDATIQAAKAYRTTQRKGHEQESAWDAVLDALDEYLKLTQEQHLREVDEAGASRRSALRDVDQGFA